MGLFSSVLAAPLAPARALLWVAEHLAARAEADESLRTPSVPDRLMDVDEALAAGEINAEQAAQLEDELLAQLITSRAGKPGAADGIRPAAGWWTP